MAVVAYAGDFQCASDYCWGATAYVFASSYGGSYCAAEWHCLARSFKDPTNYLTSIQNGSRTESDINVSNCAIDSIRKYSSSCFVIEFTAAITDRYISGMIAVVAEISDYCQCATNGPDDFGYGGRWTANNSGVFRRDCTASGAVSTQWNGSSIKLYSSQWYHYHWDGQYLMQQILRSVVRISVVSPELDPLCD